MAAAARAAADLARRSPRSAGLVGDDEATDDPPSLPGRGVEGQPAVAVRRPAPLPGGVHDDSPEAAHHLVRLPGAVLLVDGYNASMAAWPELSVDEQRRRLVAALGRLEARCGVEVTVVFDGVDRGDHRARSAHRRVRIEFTPATVEADDVIIERVGVLPPDRPVLVASDDRRVRTGARAAGANLLDTRQLHALLG